MTRVDPIALELIKGALQSARAEMGATIERTAMSPFIREKKDYFNSLFDRQGNLVAGTQKPSAANMISCVFEHYPADEMRPGDLYLYNDPYASHGAVNHSPDMVFAAPVFHQGRLGAFAVSWGHLWDIGGMLPGSISPDATDAFQEGIMLPPVRMYKQGVLNEELLRSFLRNSRFPDMVNGDLQAIMSSCRLGKQRLEELFGRFGYDTVTASFELLLHQTEAALRQAFEVQVPDGRYAFRDYLDSDSATEPSPWVDVVIEKQGGKVTLDFTATSDQVKKPLNFVMDETIPDFVCGLYLTHEEPSILFNAGFVKAFAGMKTRKGSLVDPMFPAPTGLRAHTKARVINSIMGALALATKGNVPAASPVYVVTMLRSHDAKSGTYTLCIEGHAVGHGARPFADGIDAVYSLGGGGRNYPVEFAEIEFGMRVEAYAIHTDSGGPGRWRGGCGIVRDMRITDGDALFANRVENLKFPAWGVNGGHGAPPSTRIVVNPGTPEEREIKPMTDGNRLKAGDLLRIMTPGGGGWGNPLHREPERVRDDVLNGYVSRASALEHYAVALEGPNLDVNEAETRKLRAGRRGATKMFHQRGAYHDEAPPDIVDQEKT
ncbi:MAG: hydantoinase B/oxoprolinase family protein [Candidatus Lambdaproteobacteria bacterium]|nr:hydantoinase B/oxoprolinase family protein [Candidatus Lambdaproteobacteria bacterium]